MLEAALAVVGRRLMCAKGMIGTSRVQTLARTLRTLELILVRRKYSHSVFLSVGILKRSGRFSGADRFRTNHGKVFIFKTNQAAACINFF